MRLEALVGTLCRRDNRSVADQGIVYTRVGNQVGLEFIEVDIEGTIEAQGRGDGADDLGNQAIQMLIRGPRDVEVAAANFVDSLVVDEESAVGVLDSAVGRQDCIVRLHDGGRNALGRIDGELELGLLAVLGRQTLQEKSTKTGAGTASEGMEDQEALERVAAVC